MFNHPLGLVLPCQGAMAFITKFTAALYSGTPTLLACKSSALLLEYSHILISPSIPKGFSGGVGRCDTISIYSSSGRVANPFVFS